ncbi:MAG: 30S ribosomal protein S12 methylthiotransferase RimO [Actinomycetota bacterium]|nr:30S ribosomal protein S12 methylthiotransferase RimO [Actinomycetota bacterium]
MTGVRTFYVETLGCPKNQVDSDKLTGTLLADGMAAVDSAEAADLVVVNTCAFIEEARQESIDVVLQLADRKATDARLVVTGCMAERYGDELAQALPEADAVAGFGVPVTLGRKPSEPALPSFDLLNLPRPAPSAPWAYVKVAEGCDKACGFCAIPTFRGPQRSRTPDDVLAEIDGLVANGVREVVLVAQDLASYGRDQGKGRRSLVPLVRAAAARVERVRLLYLYPSELTEALIGAVLDTGVPYFDLSLQHVSPPLMRRMRRWGDGAKFLRRIEAIRDVAPEAAFRSNFIVGYPGETEADHDQLLAFVAQAQLDWCGFFAYSSEDGTYAAGLDGTVPRALMDERLGELRALQDDITARRRDDLIGTQVDVLVDAPGVARSHREAPEIDGVITVPDHLPVGELVRVEITGAAGPDCEAVPANEPVGVPAGSSS